MNHAFRHLRIAMYAFYIFVSLFLNLSGCNNPFSYRCTWLAWSSLRNILEWHRSNLALYVDAVKKRTANLIHVFLYLSWSAYTAMRWVAIISTRTRVHRGYELEVAGIFYTIFSPAYSDNSVFKRLTKYFESVF